MKRLDIKKYAKRINLKNHSQHIKQKVFSKSFRTKIISLAVVSVMAVIGVLSFSDVNFKEDRLTALDFSYTPPKNINSAKGTNNNPFVFVEIVPDKKMSKMRYLFDEADIESDNKYKQELKNAVTMKKLEDKGILSEGNNDNTPLNYSDDNIYENQTGYFTRAGVNQGDYSIIPDRIYGMKDYKGRYQIDEKYILYEWCDDQSKNDHNVIMEHGSGKKEYKIKKVINNKGKGSYYCQSGIYYYKIEGRENDYDLQFEYVGDGKGEYGVGWSKTFVGKGQGQCRIRVSDETKLTRIPDNQATYGNIDYEYDYDFVYEGKNKGEYNWVQNNDYPADYKHPAYDTFKNDTNGEHKIWKQDQKICIESKGDERYTYKCNNWFKKNVLGLDTAKKQKAYNIDFYTVTPEEINGNVQTYGSDNKSILDVADFIYASDYALDPADDVANGFANAAYMTNNKNNLSGTAVIKLMKRVATENKTPLVLDYKKEGFNRASEKATGGTTTDMYKLVIYSGMYGPSRFYNYFMNDFGNTMQPAIFENNGASAYTMNNLSTPASPNYMVTKLSDASFLVPSVLGLSSKDVQNTLGIVNGNLQVGNTYNHYDYTKSVTENVYFNIENEDHRGFSSAGLMNDIYTSYTDRAKAFAPVLKDTSTLSCANIFKYLLNYSKNNPSIKKDEMNILDVEPCKDFTKTKLTLKNNNYSSAFDSVSTGNTWIGFSYPKGGNVKDSLANRYLELVCRNLASNYYGKINVLNKTSSEFAGDISDYITSYDLIYMGDNVGMFNTVNGKTVYNDFAMDGRIYSHIGDRMIGGMRLSGLLKKDQMYQPNHDGNAYTSVPKWADPGWKSWAAGETLPSDAQADIYSRHRTANGYNIDTKLWASPRILNAESYRFSGNDISEKVCAKLKEYANGGYAIIAADSFKNCSTTTLDKNSQMYEFFKAVKEKDNVVAVSKVSDGSKEASIKKAMNHPKASIDLLEQPVRYNRNSDNSSVTYNTDNILKCKFKINENSTDNGTYTAYFIVDSNADGYYDKKEAIKRMKNLKKDVIYTIQKAILDNSDMIGGVSWQLLVEKDGETNKYNRAKKMGCTCIKRQSSSEKKTIKVLQIMPDVVTENPLICNKSVRDFDLSLYNNTKFKDVVVGTNLDNDYGNGVFMTAATPEAGKDYDGLRPNLEREYYTSGSVFNKYASNIDDFDFAIESTTVSRYVRYFLDNTTARNKLITATNKITKSNDGEEFKPDEYDVVIMGFGDRYSDIYTAFNRDFINYNSSTILSAKKMAINNLIDFIDSKRVFVYSHDVTSFINRDFTNYSQNNVINTQRYWPFCEKGYRVGSTEYNRFGETKILYGPMANWGYSINTYLRARLGIDRFGITDSENTLNANYDTAYISTYGSGKDAQYREVQGYANGALSYNLHDKAITSNYTDTWFKKFDENNDGVGLEATHLYTPNYFDYNTDHTTWDQMKNFDQGGRDEIRKVNKYTVTKDWDRFDFDDVRYTSRVTKVNDGQITNYPYKLDDTIDTAYTHQQFYQFNLDNKNAVVWYCLSGKDGVTDSVMYEDSPNDVRNYYHMYSVGNIYFFGGGYSPKLAMSEEAGALNDTKMLINVMVSAGKNKEGGEGIDIENSDGQGEDEKLGTVDVMYVYSDKNDTSQTLLSEAASKLKVDFSVYDPYNSTQMAINVYRKDGSDWKLDSDISLKKESDNVAKDSEGYIIFKDTTYSLYLDAKKYIKNKDSCYWKITAKTIGATDAEDTRGYENVVKVVRRNIVDMNDDK